MGENDTLKEVYMKLSISILQVEQVTQSYVDWYLMRKLFGILTINTESLVLMGNVLINPKLSPNEDVNLYGIFDNSYHIGNIIISGLSSYHRKAELTYVIGETNYWGKVASFAITNMIQIVKRIWFK